MLRGKYYQQEQHNATMMVGECFIRSRELCDPYPPVKCVWVKRISSELCTDMGVFRLVPALPRHYYNTADDIEYVILVQKAEGEKLSPFGGLPMRAYLCCPKMGWDSVQERIMSNQIEILDWVELIEKP